MQYVPGQAQANLESDGVRRFTEEELRNIARALAEGDTALTGLTTRVTSLEGRVTSLETRMTAAETAATALTGRVTTLETWKTSIDTLPVVIVQLSTQHGTTNNNYSKILFDTVVIDTVSGWDTTNKRYRPTRAGYYHFYGVAYGTISTGLARALGRLTKNGSAYTYGSDFATTGNVGMTNIATTVFMNGTTDYVEMEIFITATTPIVGSTGNPGLCMMAANWVRP